VETEAKPGMTTGGRMLLFITGSRDVTTNPLFENCKLAAFRLNYDLWQDYSGWIQLASP
jgi:hypothetical protein